VCVPAHAGRVTAATDHIDDRKDTGLHKHNPESIVEDIMNTNSNRTIEQRREASDRARPTPKLRRRRLTLSVAAAALAGMTLFGATGVASAAMSQWVNVAYRNFAAPASDCTAYAGAHMRADKMAQGEAQVPCQRRHTQTVTSVRLVRWNGSAWVALPWSTYTWTNSFGTGPADLVTNPARICGNTAWYTEVYSTVTTGTASNTVWFTNNYQYYDPCV
jgi:hypothetical protein